MDIESAFFETTDYEITEKKLGEGSYGVVYVAKKIETQECVAAKIINVGNSFDGRQQMLFLRESLILHKLDHPAIVKFIGINFKSFSDNTILQPTIITEYLPHGSLKENLNKERSSNAESEWSSTKKYINLLGISDAMRYLHEEGIVHRDLKPENILIDSDFYPRVCDFGLSKCFPSSLTKSMQMTMTGEFGTPLYSSPEILRGEEHYDESVDVYAFGMIAYEIVTGEQPFSELGNISPFTLINKIISGYRPKFSNFVTDKMQELISRCWSESPGDRPTFDEIFNELSQDLSYFKDTPDDEEVEDYLDKINEKRKERFDNKMKADESEKELREKVDELSKKLAGYNIESDSILSANDKFYDSVVSFFGPKNKRNITKALDQLKESSEKGNRYASFIIGYINEMGIEVEKNIPESIKYYTISYQQGNPKGLVRIGRCYHLGLGVKKDFIKAKEYYENAAKYKDGTALYNLGNLYENGLGVEPNYKKAKELYEKASELGHIGSLNNLGSLFENGQGVKQDYKMAKKYYEEAYKHGNAYAANNLGSLYENGLGVKQDYSKAKEFYEKASKHDNPDAFYNLGFLYENGNGVKQDYKKAIENYKKAGELGHVAALNDLGTIYKEGTIVTQNYGEAKTYYEKAAELNNAESCYHLGNMYENGLGVAKNYIKAIEFYEKAAKMGDADSCNNLGILYELGKGVPTDYKKAKEYYEKAADLGNEGSLFNLGNLYKKGLGVKHDYLKAIELYEKAGDKGSRKAFFNIGILYENGEGVDKDIAKAEEYYKKAAELGDPYAQNRLKSLSKK